MCASCTRRGKQLDDPDFLDRLMAVAPTTAEGKVSQSSFSFYFNFYILYFYLYLKRH